MNFIKQINRIKKTHLLIQQEQTGTPNDFARRLNISRSHLYNILEFLRDFGANIKYSKKSESFFYTSHFDLELHYSLKIISDNETKEIFGGFHFCPISLTINTFHLKQ